MVSTDLEDSVSEFKRAIPAEYLEKRIRVTWDNGTGEQSFIGFLVFSGQHSIRLEYFRRNHETHRVRRYVITIPAAEITEWKAL